MSTSKEDGEYGEGEEIAFTVVYSHDMDVLGTPTIPLNSGGEASFTLGGRRQVGFEQPPKTWPTFCAVIFVSKPSSACMCFSAQFR